FISLALPIPPPFPYTTLFRSPWEERAAAPTPAAHRPENPALGPGLERERHRSRPEQVHRPHDHPGEDDEQPLELHAQHGVAGSQDRKSTRLNSSHEWISYAVF